MTNGTAGGGAEPPRDIDRRVIDLAIKLIVVGLFAYWSLTLVAPFVVIVVWAAILATAIYPVHGWVKTRFGGRSTPASLLITLVGLALVLGPAAGLTASLARNLQHLAHDLAAGTLDVPLPDSAVQDLPLVGSRLYELWQMAYADLPGVIEQNRELVVGFGRSLLGLAAGLGGDVLIFAVAIVIAGFLYSRGERLGTAGRRVAFRLGGERGASFVGLAGATVRNVSRGVIGISLLQALLAGIGLMVAGVPGAGLITLGVLILAIIQVGPGLLLIPVTIWVWTDMETLTAALFTIYMIPVLVFDNVLKPIVMSRGLKTPMLVIFIGVIGGTLSHGLIGLFLGPIVLAVFYDLILAWVGEGDPVSAAEARDGTASGASGAAGPPKGAAEAN